MGCQKIGKWFLGRWGEHPIVPTSPRPPRKRRVGENAKFQNPCVSTETTGQLGETGSQLLVGPRYLRVHPLSFVTADRTQFPRLEGCIEPPKPSRLDSQERASGLTASSKFGFLPPLSLRGGLGDVGTMGCSPHRPRNHFPILYPPN